MTISKKTASEVANNIVTRVKTSGCNNPVNLSIGLVEDVMKVSGNASFTASLILIRKAIQEQLIKEYKEESE